jgi:hypothetical protein
MLVKEKKCSIFYVWDEEGEEICVSLECEGEKTVQFFLSNFLNWFLVQFFISFHRG